MHHPTDRITHTTVFVTPVAEHWLEREIAQWGLWSKRMFGLIVDININILGPLLFSSFFGRVVRNSLLLESYPH